MFSVPRQRIAMSFTVNSLLWVEVSAQEDTVRAPAVSSRRMMGHIFLSCLWREDHELKAGSPLNKMVLKLCYGKRLEELGMVQWWVGNISWWHIPWDGDSGIVRHPDALATHPGNSCCHWGNWLVNGLLFFSFLVSQSLLHPRRWIWVSKS